MITGDQTYTALNVGFSSNLIPANKNVYLGELDSKSQTKWKFLESNEMRNFQMLEMNASLTRSFIINRTSQENLPPDFGSLSSILDELKKGLSIVAISGDCFERLFKDFLIQPTIELNELLSHIVVFSKTKPEQKAFIV